MSEAIGFGGSGVDDDADAGGFDDLLHPLTNIAAINEEARNVFMLILSDGRDRARTRRVLCGPVHPS